MNKIIKLDWDSAFFSLKIGELKINSINDNIEYNNEFDLIYLIQNLDEHLFIPNYKLSFTECKVIFSKKIKKDKLIQDNKEVLSALKKKFDRQRIYELAFESGKFSRFKLDPNFDSENFKSLYRTWIDNSIHKNYSDDVLIFVSEKKIIGLVTYKISKQIATIGLIAVSPDCQGSGIGTKLLNAVEKELIKKDIQELLIPTQLENELACKFYSKLDFLVKDKIIVKHYWKINR